MRKYLIVSLSTGGGHVTVANSLAQGLEARGDEVLVVDLFKEINALGLHTFICEGYNLIATKAPKLYEGIYRAGNQPFIAKGSFDLTRRLSQKKILELVRSFRPDVIIAVHPIATDILGGMKHKGILVRERLVSVVTDYLAHFVYCHRHAYVDAYFVGGEVTRQDLLSRGVSPEKIHVHGIPIRHEFYNPGEKRANERFTILIMGGSMGSRNMTSVMRRLMAVPLPLSILAVCGRDEELKDKMDAFVGKDPSKEVTVFGFTKEVYRLMDQADLLISKPGGASVTEALLRKVPMVIPYMLGGQEKENRDYLVREGAAIWAGNVRQITELVTGLIQEPERLEALRENMERIARGFSVDAAIDALRQV